LSARKLFSCAIDLAGKVKIGKDACGCCYNSVSEEEKKGGKITGGRILEDYSLAFNGEGEFGELKNSS